MPTTSSTGCARCHQEPRAGGQRYGPRCHRGIQAEQRRIRRRELDALRSLAYLVDAFLEGRVTRSALAGGARLPLELRPVRPWARIR